MDRSLDLVRSIRLCRVADSGSDQMKVATWPSKPVAAIHRLPEPTRTRRVETLRLHGRPYGELTPIQAMSAGWDRCGKLLVSGNALSTFSTHRQTNRSC